MKRRAWMLDEERVLVEMWKAGAEADEIGEALRRSGSSVDNYVNKHRARLGLERRRPRWHRAELLLVAREIDMAIARIMAGTPQRTRASINQHIVNYLYADAKRQRRAAGSARIVDLGGMTQATPPGPKRKDRAA